MGESKRVSPILATVIVVALAAAAGLVGLGRRDAGGGVRIVSFPAALDEASVVAALSAVGIDDAVGSTTALVPLSDFVRVSAVPFQGANLRAPPGDPRRTPLLDELERRFSVPGPDGEPWRVLYLPKPSRARDEAAAKAFSGLGTPWAWDLQPGEGGGKAFLWLPASAWAIWLVVRKPRRGSRRGRLGRAILALSWLPLLPGATPARALLFIALEAATMTADRAFKARLLWPYAVAVAALAAMEPVSLAYLAASIPLLGGLIYLRPRILRRIARRSLHEPPAFKSLTEAGSRANAREILRALPLAVAALLVVYALIPAGSRENAPVGAAYFLERGQGRRGDEAESLLSRQLDYQYAITFGRVGDVTWGDDSYDPVYRYREEDGRMRLADAPGDDRIDWPRGTFEGAKAALAFPEPVSVREDRKKKAEPGESALQ